MASCYFSQEQLLTLAQLGSADTTNLVTNLLGFETYDSLHQLMNDKNKEVTLQLEELETSSVKVKQDIFINEVEQRNLKEQIEMFTKQQCSLNTEHSAVTIQIEELTTLLGNIVVPSVTTEGLDVTLLALNNDKTEMSTKYRTLQESGQLKINELRMSLNLVNTKLQNILQEQSKIDKEKTKLETERRLKLESISNHEAIIASLKENKCIYCGTILKKDELEKHISEEQATISLIKSTLQDKTPELDKQLNSLYDQEAEIREKIDNTNLEIEKTNAENKEAISLNGVDINKIEEQISQIQKKKDTTLKEQIEANSYKANLTSQIKQLEQRKLTCVNQLQQVNIDDKLMQQKELENKLAVLNNETVVLKERTHAVEANKTIYEFWANAFSNKGIRPLLLDKFVNEFNQIVLPYCYKANNGEFIVEFTPTAKLKSGLERNKLGLQVIEKDKIRNYKALSGGEKTRVNLPLCLGLNKWVSTKFGIQNGILGLIVLDELFAWTDDKFRDNVAELLNEEGKTKSIFVIDHNTTLASYTNNLWQVSKEDEITKLEVI
jgi:DNA repair exonuclease SbcCD ATPase subunit